MIDQRLVRWCQEEIERGITKEELREALLKLGHSEKEINELMTTVEENGRNARPVKKASLDRPGEVLTFPPMEETFQKANKKTEKYKPVLERTPKKEHLRELFNRESHSLEKLVIGAIILIILFILLIYFILFPLLKASRGGPIWDPLSPLKIDGIPPKVSVITPETGWMSLDNIKIECTDSGIDFSSGCDNSTYAYYLSEGASCPDAYEAYAPTLTGEQDGFLCATAKDMDENTGFSEALPVKFDSALPGSMIEGKEGLFSENFSVSVSDFDEGSGLNKCFYRVLSSGSVVAEWSERQCNSSVVVPVGPIGCQSEGAGVCVLEVYATDIAGNQGTIVSASFDIDFVEPVPFCSPGDSEVCSSLKGVCSSSVKLCESNGHWGECLVMEVPGYEEPESSCNDGEDNDCDGHTDEDDSDCSGECVDLCSSEETRCVGDFQESCGNCDDDSCLEWCDLQDCSDCTCTCGNYTTGNESDLVGACNDGIDNDCDGDVDDADPDCGECVDDCSLGTSQCVGSTNQTCGECDGDDCLDWCDDDCSDCSCECGAYTMSGNESLVSCSDGIDNDCDGATDGTDADCGGGGCFADGETCSQGSDCCSENCDNDDLWCLGCNGGFDLFDGQCESSCGAHYTCDEKNPGETGSSWSCCLSNCWYDFRVGSCSCPISGTCTEGDGYCLRAYTCYYNISCTTSGWQYESTCNPSDVCTPLSLITDKACTDTGCTSGTSHPCTGPEYECENSTDTQHCESDDFYCCYGSGGWQWRETPETEDCEDGYDNDCDGYTDGEDSDCGSVQTLCFIASTIELWYSSGEYTWYGDTAEGSIGFSVPTKRRVYTRWNTQNVPDTATVVSVKFKYDCTRRGPTIWGHIYEMEHDPNDHIEEAEFVFNDCENGTLYAGGSGVFPIEGDNGEIDLGSSAVSRLQSLLGDDWFAIGLAPHDTDITASYDIMGNTVGATPEPTICVNYTT